MKTKSNSKQNGFSLIEIMLIIGLMTTATMLTFETKLTDLEQERAKNTGVMLSEYSNASRAWISDNIGAASTTKYGTEWLKHTSCGGQSSVAYLPCSYPNASPLTASDRIPFGQIGFTSVIISTGSDPDWQTKIETETTSFMVNDKIRSDLSGIAYLVAVTSSDLSSFGGDDEYESDYETAKIKMTQSNAPNEYEWLRTDGSNKMLGSINFDISSSEAMRSIRNLSRLHAAVGEILTIGNIGGAGLSSPDQVVVDANQEIKGRLTIENQKNDAIALAVEKGDIQVLDGGLYASKSIVSEESLVAPIFFDKDNPSYFVAPASNSRINSLTTEGRITANEFIQVKGLAYEGGPCEENGLIGKTAGDIILACIDLGWERTTAVPKMHRFIFNSDQSWTVPDKVKSAFVTMAGGGGSGMGWRVANFKRSGSSGGYVFSQPVNLVPGETIQITVGKGAKGYYPYNTMAFASPGDPYYIFAAPPGDNGYGGYPGGATRLVSPSQGVLLECTGGNGAYMDGIDNFTATAHMAGYTGAMTGSGVPTWASPKRYATGLHVNPEPGGAGLCGPSNYGIGNAGTPQYFSAGLQSGVLPGGITPFGYGSGGSVHSSGCFINFWEVGSCSGSGDGRDGVIFMDVLY